MPTTIAIPDELYRQIKTRAARKRMNLEEYVAAALRESLVERPPAAELGQSETEYTTDVSALREDCVLPLIDGETTAELRSITGSRIAELLDGEGSESAAPPGRP